MKEIKWKKLIGVKQPFFIAHLLSDMFQKNVREAYGVDFSFKNHRTELEGHYCDENEFMEFCSLVEQKHKQDSSFLRKLLDSYVQACKDYFLKTNEIKNIKLEDESNEELARIFNEVLVDQEMIAGVFRYLPLIAEQILEKEIKEKLRAGNSDAEDAYQKLTAVAKEGWLLKEKINLYRISQIKEEQERLKQVKDHNQEFGWLNVRNFGGHSWADEELIQRSESIEQNPVDEFNKQREDAEKNFKEITSGFESDKEFTNKINLLRDHIYFRTFGRDEISRAQFNTYPLLFEIAQRIGVEYDDVVFLSYEEIEDTLLKNTKPDLQKIRLRQQYYVVLTVDGVKEVIEGKRLEDDKTIYSNVPVEFKGSIACQGKATGRVRVITNRDDIGKVKKGDILVAPTTTPDYIIAMEKAAAFITELGGVTSHAAIVSREMNKPCIVGVENITKMLKDDDYVEVDADKGMIRKIKNMLFEEI